MPSVYFVELLLFESFLKNWNFRGVNLPDFWEAPRHHQSSEQELGAEHLRPNRPQLADSVELLIILHADSELGMNLSNNAHPGNLLSSKVFFQPLDVGALEGS